MPNWCTARSCVVIVFISHRRNISYEMKHEFYMKHLYDILNDLNIIYGIIICYSCFEVNLFGRILCFILKAMQIKILCVNEKLQSWQEIIRENFQTAWIHCISFLWKPVQGPISSKYKFWFIIIWILKLDIYFHFPVNFVCGSIKNAQINWNKWKLTYIFIFRFNCCNK